MNPDLQVEQIVLAAASLYGLGVVGILALLMMPRFRHLKAEISRAVFSAVLVVSLVLGSFAIGSGFLQLALIAMWVRVSWEAAIVMGLPAGRLTVLVGGLGIFVGVAQSEPAQVLGFLTAAALSWCLLGVILAVTRLKISAPIQLARWLFFPVLPALMLICSCKYELGCLVVLAAFVVTEVFDGLALVSGKFFGHTLLAPSLSPNKTVEGVLGGLFFALVTVLLGAWYFDFSALVAVGFGVAFVVLAVCGDLLASLIKRIAGQKDFPVLFASQGGALDAFDAWILAGGLVGAIVVSVFNAGA